MPNTSDEHEDILKAFREELFSNGILHEGDSIGTDDQTLLRFLRARSFDLKQAIKMFTDCQNWRKSVEGVGIDGLYRQIDTFDYPERPIIFECWPMWFHKTDKMGRPIHVESLGAIDLNKLYKSCTPERHWHTLLVSAEAMVREILPAAARAAGKPVGSSFIIIDLEGFGLAKFWQMKTLIQNSFQVSQDYYPETMGKMAVINAPSSFTYIWAVIKPWLSKETAAKVDVLGSDYKTTLLELIDEENLPNSLGGSCACADTGGCHMSGAGPWLDGRVGWGPKAKKVQQDETSDNQRLEEPKET